MDKIIIEDLKIFAYHGVFEEEKRRGQNFIVNAVLSLNTEQAGAFDDLSLSVDYGKVCVVIEKVMTAQSHDLLETAAQSVAYEILKTFPLTENVEIEIKKPDAPIPADFGSVSVKINRGWHTAVIALGSNIGESRQLIESAVKTISENSNFRDVRVSELIVTKPYGYLDQPDFLNGALICKTLYSPHGLLDLMQSIENNAGRTRKIHWGPRTLDLDLIFYDSRIISDKRLNVPHPDMQNRMFVLEPVSQIAPYYRHPALGMTVQTMLERLSEKQRERAKKPSSAPAEKKISMIAAVARNGVIGSGGQIPWDIPEDRSHFKWLTTGEAVIMGRTSFEEIGSVLPNRFNIIVSTSKNFVGDNLTTARNFKEAIEIAKNLDDVHEIFICGGEQIYCQGLEIADRIYLTELDDEYEGDAFFPDFSDEEFVMAKRVRWESGRLSFNLYERSRS